MSSYDAVEFDPPAPLTHVSFETLDGSRRVERVPMLIDTGADVSLLPLEMVKPVANEEAWDERYELEGFDGTRSIAPAVVLTVRWLGRTFRGRYLLTDAPTGILGRNILNHLRLLLDGPGQRWEEHHS